MALVAAHLNAGIILVVTLVIIIIMDISMVHDPWQDLGHNAPYKKLQKNG